MFEYAEYEPGNKVVLLPRPSSNDEYTWSLNPTSILELKAGDVIEIDSVGPVSVNFIDKHGVKRTIMKKYIRHQQQSNPDSTAEKHKCHCPKENFAFNGLGCQCGGE